MPSWDEILKGTSGNDVINGGAGDDYLQGKAGDDILRGEQGNDQLHGDADSDYLVGGDGNDTVDGGGGIDTAVYSGSVKDYTFTLQGGNAYISHTGGTQTDGTDWLLHVERLMFADATIDLTQNNAPIAYDDSASTNEDVGTYSSGSASVRDNDFDWEHSNLTVTPGTFNGTFGTLTLNANGTYSYTPYASTQELAQGETVQDSFNYTVSDGSLTDTGTLTINISGNNDAPVAVADTDTTSENAIVTVDVVANDTDVDNGATLTVTDASVTAGQGSVAIVGNQVEFDPGTDFDYLAVGESTDVVINYTIEDEHGASSSSTATVTVTGTNDAPTIDTGNTTATGSVDELVDGDPDENAFTHEESGSVAFDDLDLSDSHTAGFTPQGGSYVGTFSLDAVDQSGNSVGWNFSVEDSDIDFLDEGQTLTQTYTVEINDGNGGTTTQDVTITITGATDEVAWYIDNSAVGSANLGTQADPYTSIAAFNAAQGTVGGPQVGESVFLLAGTGVYAEADGINLLDGQTLTGVASGALRPTIQPTSGNGVDVADDNVLTGFDVVTIGSDGISDTASNTGGLTVSDVSVTTTSADAIVLDTASNVSITDVTLIASGGHAILGSNVNGFSLSESTLTGGASSDDVAAFTGLTGTADFLGNTMAGGGDVLNVVNSSGSLDLTIADGTNQAVIGQNDAVNGADGVHVETGGTAALTLTVDGVDFLGAVSDLLQVTATGSSTQDLTIANNNFLNTHPATTSGGGGVFLTGGGAGSNITVDYDFENNVLQGADGHAFAAIYTQTSGDVRGYIADNVIGINDGVGGFEGSSGGGSGIFIALDRPTGAVGSATHSVNIVDNDIHDIDSGVAGIFLRSQGGDATNSAILEATVTGNVVDEFGDFAFSALAAQIGGTGFDFAQLGLVLEDNVLDLSGADFGGNAVYLEQGSADAHFYFPDYAGSPDGEFLSGTASADLDAFWTGMGNVFTNGAFPNFSGGVDAGGILGAGGEQLVFSPWP